MTRTTEAHAEGRKPRTDEELLAAVRAQRPDAFPDLRDRHWHTAVVVARLHTPSRQDAEQLAGTSFDQLLAEVDAENGSGDSREESAGSFLRARLVAVVGRAGTDGEPAAEPVSGIYLGLPASWQAVLWYLEIEGLELERTAAVLGLSPAATTALHLRARAGLRTAYRQARLDLPGRPECAECAADLGALADGRLPAERARAVQAHLGECPRCTADHLYLQDTGRGLRTWLLPVLAGVPLWDTRTDELVEQVRAAGRMSAGRLSAARGTDVAGGALAAVHVSRRGRKVLLGAGVLAAAAALAGVAVTGPGGLGDGTTQATSRSGGSGATDSSAPSPVAPSGTSDDGAMIARGAGAGAAAPGGAGGTLSLPTLEPSPGPLTESAAEARRAQTGSGTIITASAADRAATADGAATAARHAGAGSDSAAERRPGTLSRAEGSNPDDDRAPRSAASRAESSGADSSGGGATGRGTIAAGGGGSTSAPSEGDGGSSTRDSLDGTSGNEAPADEVPADESPASEVPVVETPAPQATMQDAPVPAATAEDAPVPAATAEGTPAPAAGPGGSTGPTPDA